MALDGSELTRGVTAVASAVLRVWGDVDFANADELRHEIVAASQTADRTVVLDATGLAFCDVAGLRAMDTAREELERGGLRLVVRPSKILERLMEVTGIAFDRE
jgi:anti-sigma B factor antagonist